MWSDFCVDQAFDCVVSKLIVHDAVVPRRFVPRAWFPLKSEEILYSDMFPECRDCFGPDSLDGVGVHYEAVGGSSARPAHYMDWRNHKDLWLYDCFAIAQRRRPVFGSLSTQPFLPGPNPNYGGHILFYRRDQIRSRCLFTFGDKQQPRRSMLLTLDTVLHGRTKKDGAAAQSKEGREEVVYRILSRYDHILKYHALNAQQLWAKTFEGKKVPYPNGDLLIECQIFGGMDLARDAWGFVPECETDPFFDDKFHIKTETMQANEGAVNALYPNMQILRYYFRDYQPIGAVTARNAPWKHHLDEIDE
ncbi:MAG: DUF3626 domain-containing protein [Polyangiaceae bacterium]